jgi:hypothetical protein
MRADRLLAVDTASTALVVAATARDTAAMDADVEEATLRTFIRRTRVERYVALLRTRTRRKQLIAKLHDLDLDDRYVFPITPTEQTTEHVYDLLRRRGAPEACYVISTRGWDGDWMDLWQALENTVPVADAEGTLISCIPGQLAYYQSEGMYYVLQRKAS